MKRLFFAPRLLLAAASLVAAACGEPARTAAAHVVVENAWARATPPGAEVGAAYATLRNRSQAEVRLQALSSPAAGRVEVHDMKQENGVMRMRRIEALAIPPGGSVELAPGGKHLMLMDLRQPLQAGQRIALKLRFSDGSERAVELAIR